MEQNSVIIFILIIFAIGSIAYKFYLPKIKGTKGEFSVARILQKLDSNQYKIFNDIYITTNDKSTQIDHLVISIYGIYVIETKNYGGWIHGYENSEYWTQTFYKNKQKFRNPVKQNWAHIYFLKNVLSNFKQVNYNSIIVFAGNARLKNINSSIPVIYKNNLLNTIKQNQTPILSSEQVENIVIQLSKFITNDKNKKNEHTQYVKKNIQERKANENALICPNCKGILVIRKGSYGQFYGCSNYPKCKFSKKT